MHVLVTGSAGFLGRHAARALAARGDLVTGVDRRPDASAARGDRRTRHLVEDLTSPGGRWRAVAAEADAVLHLAARPGVRGAGAELEACRSADILTAAVEVLAAAPPEVPVVVASSSAVYGEAPAGRGSREDDPLRPRGSYGRWKLAVEQACAERAGRGGLVSVARPFTVAGPGQRPDMALSRWLEAVTAGRPVEVLGGLDRSRDISDVTDVVAGLVALVDDGVRHRRSCTVNLGAGHPRTHAEVLDAVGRITGRRVAVRLRPAHPDEVAHTRSDPARARRLLGLDPSTDLDDLVRRQLAAATASRAA
ncbi:MAG: NAD-dependent epimerase/dehydratase family protein [Kineosporiaceae bacterium]